MSCRRLSFDARCRPPYSMTGTAYFSRGADATERRGLRKAVCAQCKYSNEPMFSESLLRILDFIDASKASGLKGRALKDAVLVRVRAAKVTDKELQALRDTVRRARRESISLAQAGLEFPYEPSGLTPSPLKT